MQVTINGCALNVEVMGPQDGPVLIAHHGGGGIGSLAEPKATFGPLSDRFRVVVFDARGCGHSEGVPPYSHAQWAADVDGLRQWTGADKIVVAGGSYGGFIALEYAVAYPEHVAAIVLRDTSADADNLKLALRERAQPGPRRDQLGQLRPLLVRADPRRRGPQGALGGDHPALRLRVRPRSARRRASRPASTATNHTTGASSTTMPTYDLKPQLPAVTAPTLVTVGRRDWVTPVSAAQTIASLMPNAKLVVFEKSGHSPQIEERELFLSTVRDFLDSVVVA